MRKFVLFIFLFVTIINSISAQNQFEIAGINIPRTVSYKNKKLQLNGFGTRSKFLIDVYAQALYLQVLTQDPEIIINHDNDMAIRIQILSSKVSANKFSKAFYKGMIKSIGEEKLQDFETEMNFLDSLLCSEEIKNGDIFEMFYLSSESKLMIIKNGRVLGEISGLEFKKAFFGIWLSDNPVEENLKKELLGIY